MANRKVKGLIKKVQGGFSVEPTQEYVAKKEREQLFKERKKKNNENPNNKDIYALMMGIASRQEEIYDSLKEK